jgi:hypothetical protein
VTVSWNIAWAEADGPTRAAVRGPAFAGPRRIRGRRGKAFFLSNRRDRKGGLRHRLVTLGAAGAVATTGGVIAAATPASAALYVPGRGAVTDVTIAQAASTSGLSGCRGVATSTWVAIALAESRGNPRAHATGIEDSRGLWQVNLWANRDLVGSRDLYDVATNAWAAHRVCQRQGPRAWSTFTNGAYRSFLGRGYVAAQRAGV